MFVVIIMLHKMHLSCIRIQVEELRSRLTGAEKLDTRENVSPTKSESLNPSGISGSPPALPEKVQRDVDKGTQRRESNVSSGVIVCLCSLWSSESKCRFDAWHLLVFIFCPLRL